jgi:eukaryotic-like serine/threonine-protein kinase
MADPSQKLPDEDASERFGQSHSEGLDIEAGLAAAYGPHTKPDSKPDRLRSFYQPGAIIADKFLLIEPIGEGGMGTVWYAEQTAPIKRKVALKLIKPGLDSHSVLARFDAERQALAMMEHPNIARVFDGGITEQGHPFFVMELVKGTSLTAFCDERRLDLNERIGLFVSVCQAIQHAHQKGIIHRDIKPSNIMVGLYDGKPVPKVIDFGVAKAIGPSLTDVSLHTDFGAVVGTAEYMSPEQAELNNLDIDTRSDVYSLGVLMYELLAGSPPFPRAELAVKGLHEVLRVIREVDPQRPSAKLSTSKMRASIAALRGIEPGALGKLLSGDLDWIVMKALEKDRNRRYDTAIGLSMDLQRYLAGETVLAAPPSRLYRVRKFIRRNRSSVIAASLVLFSLIGGMAGTTYGLFRARDEQRNAEEQESLAKTQRTRAEQREQDAIDAVKRFGDTVSKNPDLKNNPSLESLRKTLLQEPLSFFQSLRTRLQSDPDTRPESLSRLAAAASDLARLTNEIGDKQNSLKAYRESIDIYQKLIDEHPTDIEFQCSLAQCHNNIGNLLNATGEPSKALAAYEAALEIQERLAHANPTVTEFQSDLARSHNNIGVVFSETGEPAKALVMHEKALEIQERLVQTDPTISEFQSHLAASHHNVGSLLRSTGELAKALAAFERALEIRERLAQANPTVTEFQSDLARSHNTIGVVFGETGEPAKALAAYGKAIEIRERLVQANPTITEFQSRLALSYNNIGWELSEMGEKAKALAAFEKAVEIQARLAEANPTVTRFQSELSLSHNNIGILFDQTNQPAKALAAYEKALEIRERLVQANPTITEFQSDLGGTLNNIAMIEIDNSQFDKARVHILEAIRWQKQALTSNPAHPTYLEFLKGHYRHLLATADGLSDNDLRLEAQRGLAELAELAARDPAFKEIDRRIKEVVAGAATNGVEELHALAQRCSDTRRFALAARFWNQALEAEPLLAESRQSKHAYNAACAAALAGCGEGVDDSPPSDEAKAKLRGQALHWLQSELETWKKHLENATAEQRQIAVFKLQKWQSVPDLSGVRGDAINKLPEAERAEWKSLWQSAAEILEQAKSVFAGNESDQ